MNQPKRITFQGNKYVRFSKHKDLGKGISEGPFYKLDKVESDWLYMPDLAFCMGQSKEPLAMHRIQIAF